MSGRTAIDMTGKQVGFLTVLERAPARETDGPKRGASWRCRCVCGKETVRRGYELRDKDRYGVKSCGCKNAGRRSHGLCGTTEYRMYDAAKFRAKERGLAFDINPIDIEIPAVCPVLGIKLKVNTGASKAAHNSPTLDRIDSSKGYIKGNIRVISHRANTLKSDATVEELTKVLEDVIRLQGPGIRTGGAV